jgi:leucine-rich repeat protein SHOC2
MAKKIIRVKLKSRLNIIDYNKVFRNLILCGENLTEIPNNIGNYGDLELVRLTANSIDSLPQSIGNLGNLIELHVNCNYLISLPDSISNLSKLKILYLNHNYLLKLPQDIGNLDRLEQLNLSNNKLKALPDSIGNLAKLVELDLSSNRLISLPDSMTQLFKLTHLYLSGNSLSDLSLLRGIPNLHYVEFNGVVLPRRYWWKLSDWQPDWLQEEKDPQVRQMLIDHFGYQKICKELNIRSLDKWRGYNLLKIENVEQLYDRDGDPIPKSKPIALLKMTCPSTAHTHILRVPPEMTSAEAAITWANHGVHPDQFINQS